MRNILVAISCPTCGFQKHIKSHTLVLPEMEPELRKRILSETMFSYCCPTCGKEIIYLHPFIYHDKAHNFFLYMGEDSTCLTDAKEQFSDTILRQIQTPTQLAEKIRIFEDGFDDRVLSFLTLFLKKKYPKTKQILYYDFDRETQSIWLTFIQEDGEEQKGIDMDTYMHLQKQYRLFYLPSYTIDETWASLCLQKQEPPIHENEVQE